MTKLLSKRALKRFKEKYEVLGEMAFYWVNLMLAAPRTHAKITSFKLNPKRRINEH